MIKNYGSHQQNRPLSSSSIGELENLKACFLQYVCVFDPLGS